MPPGYKATLNKPLFFSRRLRGVTLPNARVWLSYLCCQHSLKNDLTCHYIFAIIWVYFFYLCGKISPFSECQHAPLLCGCFGASVLHLYVLESLNDSSNHHNYRPWDLAHTPIYCHLLKSFNRLGHTSYCLTVQNVHKFIKIPHQTDISSGTMRLCEMIIVHKPFLLAEQRYADALCSRQAWL